MGEHDPNGIKRDGEEMPEKKERVLSNARGLVSTTTTMMGSTWKSLTQIKGILGR